MTVVTLATEPLRVFLGSLLYTAETVAFQVAIQILGDFNGCLDRVDLPRNVQHPRRHASTNGFAHVVPVDAGLPGLDPPVKGHVQARYDASLLVVLLEGVIGGIRQQYATGNLVNGVRKATNVLHVRRTRLLAIFFVDAAIEKVVDQFRAAIFALGIARRRGAVVTPVRGRRIVQKSLARDGD